MLFSSSPAVDSEVRIRVEGISLCESHHVERQDGRFDRVAARKSGDKKKGVWLWRLGSAEDVREICSR